MLAEVSPALANDAKSEIAEDTLPYVSTLLGGYNPIRQVMNFLCLSARRHWLLRRLRVHLDYSLLTSCMGTSNLSGWRLHHYFL